MGSISPACLRTRFLAAPKNATVSTRAWLAFHCTISNNTPVIPFRVDFRPGVSLYEQVVYAAKKALISGQLRPGDPFPSVRALSSELKINPNTAHKVVTHLLYEGLLKVLPGTGTVVAELPSSTAAERSHSNLPETRLRGRMRQLTWRAWSGEGGFS